MRPRPILATLMSIALSLPAPAEADEASPKSASWDCGTLALYHLLQLQGRPTDLGRLQVVLGRPGREGHSFRELRAAARRLGLPLDAVILPRLRTAIDEPILLFFKREREGHFVVVRPVGHTGRLIQVLDGERPPIVIDADRLLASPSWTGLALVPHRPNPLVPVAVTILAACMTAFVLRLRRRSQGTPLVKRSAGAALISRGLMRPSRSSPAGLETRP